VFADLSRQAWRGKSQYFGNNWKEIREIDGQAWLLFAALQRAASPTNPSAANAKPNVPGSGADETGVSGATGLGGLFDFILDFLPPGANSAAASG